jgi:hypothetical protein
MPDCICSYGCFLPRPNFIALRCGNADARVQTNIRKLHLPARVVVQPSMAMLNVPVPFTSTFSFEGIGRPSMVA